jgi:hypothetical protein
MVPGMSFGLSMERGPGGPLMITSVALGSEASFRDYRENREESRRSQRRQPNRRFFANRFLFRGAVVAVRTPRYFPVILTVTFGNQPRRGLTRSRSAAIFFHFFNQRWNQILRFSAAAGEMTTRPVSAITRAP